jgi:hypothetical protein
MRETYAATRDAITNSNDLRAAFALATAAQVDLQSWTDEVGKVRAELAARIYDADALGLGKLAREVGMSKSRFDRLVAKGRAATEKGPGTCAD